MLTLSVSGMERSQKILRMLEQMAQAKLAVELRDKQREDAESTNVEVFNHLAEGNTRDRRGPQKRDFISPTPELNSEMDKIMLKRLESEVHRYGGKEGIRKATRLNKSGKLVSAAKEKARQAMTTAFKLAAERWQREIQRRMDSEDWLGGGAHELSKEYATYKQGKWSFTSPIGKASGQAYDNILPGKNLKVVKR